MNSLFSSSESTQAYLKMGLFGFAGSGKTRTATEVAIGLIKYLAERKLPVSGLPAYFLDTETGADYVRPRFKQEGIELRVAKTRAFSDLIPAVKEAEKNGSILIIDSITHFWREFTESYATKRQRKRGLEFSDWAYLKAEWGKFTDIYINSHSHIIMCGRAGYEFDFFRDENDKKQLEKTGVKMKAETETGYEPSVLVLMEREMELETKKVVRRGYVLKERFGVIDGCRFDNPTFANFKPHVELLNIGGEHLGVDTSRTSEGMIEKPDSAGYLIRQRCEILHDEIQSLMVKHHPSTGGADKKAKIELLEFAFGTPSWERVKTFAESDLMNGLAILREKLEGEQNPLTLPDFSGSRESEEATV